jgi:transposase
VGTAHGSRFTTAFEDTTAWLAAHAGLTVLAMLLRITVAAIVVRVVAEAAGKRDRLAGLRRIGIDEISYRKGQRYLLCVVDHDTGHLVWAGKNRTAATLGEFFDLLGQTRSAQLTHVSSDGASGGALPGPFPRRGLGQYRARRRAPGSVEPAAPPRRQNRRQRDEKHPLGAAERPRHVDQRPENHAGNHREINNPLYRVYLLKEQLREVFAATGAHGRQLLAGWLAWAQRCRIPEFVKLARTIKRFLPLIHNTLDHRLSNALSEATNTHIRLLTRRAYGYHSPDALVTMATLTQGGLCPPLPRRS